jgi:hypothetical protein
MLRSSLVLALNARLEAAVAGGDDVHAVVAEQADDVARPADRRHRGCHAVFEEEERAHDPGRELASRPRSRQPSLWSK